MGELAPANEHLDKIVGLRITTKSSVHVLVMDKASRFHLRVKLSGKKLNDRFVVLIVPKMVPDASLLIPVQQKTGNSRIAMIAQQGDGLLHTGQVVDSIIAMVKGTECRLLLNIRAIPWSFVALASRSA